MKAANKVKVCHLTSVHTAFDTRIFFKECISLSRQYQVTLIAPAEQNETIEGIQIIRLRQYGSRLLRFLLTNPELYIKALLVNAKVYHFHDPELIPFGLLLRLCGKKVIYDVHEDVRADLKEKPWLPMRGFFSAVYSFFDRLAAKAFHIVLAESAYDVHYPRHTIVRNFVDYERLLPMQKKDYAPSNTLLFVGSLGARRGLAASIEALYLLKQKGILLNMICVGKVTPALQSQLGAMPYYQEIKGQLRFEGYAPLPLAYKEAVNCFAGLALPENVENHRYSYPTKLFEYMAVGLPVICSDFPINREVVERHRCGICVDPANVQAIAAAMEQLYSNSTKAEEMGQNGMKAAEKEYNWKSEEHKLLGLYEDILR